MIAPITNHPTTSASRTTPHPKQPLGNDFQSITRAYPISDTEGEFMPDLTLPSGRVVHLKERPKWGDMRAAVNAGMAAEARGEHFGFARATELAARMTGLTVAEVDDLDFQDEETLSAEVTKRTALRPEKDEAPFENPSSPS